jgi:4-aminobutyrate aminotransferase-like enzyme
MVSDPASGVEAPACIVLEPIQGNGGVVIPPPGFLTGLRRIADACGALLIFDEIQCGFGRSGRVWACEHEGVTPDLMTIGKGIGGGVALAAILGRDDVMTTWKPDAVTSTFMANALNLAAGVAAVDALRDEQLVERSARLGDFVLGRLREELGGSENVGEVRGRGLFVGIEVVRDRGTRIPDAERTGRAIRELRARGVLVGRGGRYGNVVKLSPPLIIGEDELADALRTVTEVLA